MRKRGTTMTKSPAELLDLSGEDPVDQDFSEFLAVAKLYPGRLIIAPKDRTVTLRLPSGMVSSLKAVAQKSGVRYQALMRQFIAEGLGRLAK